jgi:hypothetical protein
MSKSVLPNGTPLVPPIVVRRLDKIFRTDDFTIAAYIAARGFALRGTERKGDTVFFLFPPEAEECLSSFYDESVSLPPIKVFQAYHRMRALAFAVRKNGGAK